MAVVDIVVRVVCFKRPILTKLMEKNPMQKIMPSSKILYMTFDVIRFLRLLSMIWQS